MNEPAPLINPEADDGSHPSVPRHVAIIMDGNGRWAKARGLPRTAGHERGVEAVRRTVEAAGDLGIEYLTVFSFSTENWRRPVAEVNTLFSLLRNYVKRDLNRLIENGVRVRVIGQRDGVPKDIAELTKKAESETAHNTKSNLTIAFNYGAREELVRAAKAIADDIGAGRLSPDNLTENDLAARLDTRDLPDPDLLIRTSGESRISNFLLWQIAYAEIVILDVLWPDFGKDHLVNAIRDYQSRDRRFGSVKQGSV
ncbi:MAG: isoprenyl transferase [Pseudomonadota bacterium]